MAKEPNTWVKLRYSGSSRMRGGYINIPKSPIVLERPGIDFSSFAVMQSVLSPSLWLEDEFKIILRLSSKPNGHSTSKLLIDNRGRLSVYIKSETLMEAFKKKGWPPNVSRDSLIFKRIYLTPKSPNSRIDIIVIGKKVSHA